MITAVDPAVGHFLGAVVQYLSATASVVDLGVTADNLATACDGFPASLAGIRLDGATGAITNSTVTGLQQGTVVMAARRATPSRCATLLRRAHRR